MMKKVVEIVDFVGAEWIPDESPFKYSFPLVLLCMLYKVVQTFEILMCDQSNEGY